MVNVTIPTTNVTIPMTNVTNGTMLSSVSCYFIRLTSVGQTGQAPCSRGGRGRLPAAFCSVDCSVWPGGANNRGSGLLGTDCRRTDFFFLCTRFFFSLLLLMFSLATGSCGAGLSSAGTVAGCSTTGFCSVGSGRGGGEGVFGRAVLRSTLVGGCAAG